MNPKRVSKRRQKRIDQILAEDQSAFLGEEQLPEELFSLVEEANGLIAAHVIEHGDARFPTASTTV